MISLTKHEIQDYLKTQDFLVSNIELLQQNSRITDYVINGKWLVRVSCDPLVEQFKLERVKTLSQVNHIIKSGKFVWNEVDYEYIIMEYYIGCNLYEAIPDLSEEQSRSIGKDIGCFMEQLHSIKGKSYDIGHYIPTIANYQGTWKDGHIEYLKVLRADLDKIDFDDYARNTITSAINYINDRFHVLEYQSGPRLLHNDLHPKNIIVNNGRLEGVIDWECSQYGEMDFELVHLMQWCLFPPDEGRAFNVLFKSMLSNLDAYKSIPYIEDRLTIYQLEHELNQLVWQGNNVTAQRIPRINDWIDGLGNEFLGYLK